MLALLLLATTPNVLADDRRDFEVFWAEQEQKGTAPLPPKDLAWQLFEWNQAQFSLGFCAEYIPADTAEEMRSFPDEDKISQSAFGRQMLAESRDSFREGMAYRSEVHPTMQLCKKELEGRGITLEAVARGH